MKPSACLFLFFLLFALLAAHDVSLAAPPAKSKDTPAPARTGEMIYLRDFGTDEVGFLSIPMQEPSIGLLIIPDSRGLDPRVKKMCDALAEQGFLALAVDLYNGRVAADEREARTLRQGVDPKDARKALETGLNFYAKSPRFLMQRVAVVALGDADVLALDLCRETKNRTLAAVSLVGPTSPALPEHAVLHQRVQRLEVPAESGFLASVPQITQFLNSPETRKNFFQRLVE